jgi:hypothetical protein
MPEPIDPASPNLLWRGLRRIFWWWPDRGPRQPQHPVRDDELKAAIHEAQADLVLRAFAKRGIGGAVGHGNSDGEQVYLCHPSRVLCRPDDVRRLDDYFAEGVAQERYRGDLGTDYGFDVDELVVIDGGLVGYRLPERVDDGAPHVEHTIADLERDGALGADGHAIAWPDHILYVTIKGTGSLCPDGEPLPGGGKATLPAPVQDASLGKGIRVSVVDTGWYPGAATDPDSPWLQSGVSGDEDPAVGAKIGPYGGHGTFVAGVLRCVAPGVTIDHEGVLDKAGACYESEITAELNEAMLNRPELISISAGCRTRRDLGLLGFVVLAEIFDLDKNGAPLVVAAAGNDSSTREFWPAAYPWVVSVGALDPDMQISDFSNYGDWVQVYALGRDLVNAFPTGTYVCYEPPHQGETRQFTGMAQWSGTSFATPIVTGTVAARLGQNKKLGARGALKAALTTSQTVTDNLGNVRPVVGPPFRDG